MKSDAAKLQSKDLELVEVFGGLGPLVWAFIPVFLALIFSFLVLLNTACDQVLNL